MLFDEYAESAAAALLSSLRIVSRVKGGSQIAEGAGLSRRGLQKALSENGNPQFSSVNAILHAMDYRLTAQKLAATSAGFESLGVHSPPLGALVLLKKY